MFGLEEARNILRVDEGDNDLLIMSLLEAIPVYIETTTGMTAEQQKNEPLAAVVSGFIITLWYYSDHADDKKLQRTIDSLLKCITTKVERGGT